MKYYLFFLLTVLFYTPLRSQVVKVNYRTVKTIPADSIKKEIKEGRTVTKVGIGALKNGINKMTLANGNILYVEVDNRKIKKLVYAKSDGLKLDELVVTDIPTQFTCGPNLCHCDGVKDCIDLTGTGLCGTELICIDNYCACDRKQK